MASGVNHESSLTSLLLFRFAHPRFRFAHPGLKSRAGSRAALRSRWGLILAVAAALLLPLREFGGGRCESSKIRSVSRVATISKVYVHGKCCGIGVSGYRGTTTPSHAKPACAGDPGHRDIGKRGTTRSNPEWLLAGNSRFSYIQRQQGFRYLHPN